MEERIVCRFRACLVFTFLLALLGALSVRLFWLQVVEHGRYMEASRSQHIVRERDPAPRGDILDCRGRVLATSRILPSVAVDPALLADREAAAAELAGLFGVDREDLLRRMGDGTRRFAWVRRGVDDPEAIARAKALVLGRDPEEPGEARPQPLVFREEMVRSHPMGPLASQVLGFVGIDGAGLEGLEKVHDGTLRGIDGVRTVVRDAFRKPIVLPGGGSVDPVPGRALRVTLDAVLQGFAEDALRETFERHRPKGAVCVLLDARTGEVRALASEPSFDPSRPGDAGPEARRARFLTDQFEPGSTFKPLVAAAAVECGAVGKDDLVDCGEGWIRIGSRTVHEHEPRGYGRIPLSRVLAVSSNCGMARVGLRLGIPRARAVLDAYGFGRPTGLGLPGEAAGQITPADRWTPTYTLVSVSFGQEIAVTPLQLAAAYLAIAGDGTVRPPRLVAGDPAADPAPVRVLSPRTVLAMREMMEDVVTEGTAKGIGRTGYRLAGKTGTAQKMLGGETRAYVSSFVGFGPVEDPRLLCLVLLDEPSRKEGVPYGSKVAAPYCAEVLRRSLRYLGVRPDEEEGAPAASLGRSPR
jgi:cell division protein FtsI/penicillin-binding protein 2